MASEFDNFEQRMRKRARGTLRSAEDVVRKAALICDQVVVTATPVDTGRARANWTTSIGRPDFSPKDALGPDASLRRALAQGKEVIASWKSGEGPIFIANGLPYIQRLDDGYSAQAPNGMTAQAVEAARHYLRHNARVLES